MKKRTAVLGLASVGVLAYLASKVEMVIVRIETEEPLREDSDVEKESLIEEGKLEQNEEDLTEEEIKALQENE